MTLNLHAVRWSELSKFARAHKLLLVVCFAAFLNSGATGLTSPILALYPREYGANTFFIGLFMTSFAMGRMLITMPTGRLSDRYGTRRIMILGAVCDCLGAVCLAFAPSYPLLVTARLMQGIGSGLFMSAATIQVAQLSSVQDRGRVTSLFQGSIFLGLTLTPFIGGSLATTLGIRAPILGYAAIEALAVLIVLMGIRLPRQADDPDVPKPETSTGKADSKPDSTTVRSLLQNRDFALIAIVGFLIFVGRSGARDTLLPLYGETIVGLDAAELGVIFTLLSLMNFLAIPVAGMLADRVGRKLPILIGLALNALCVLMLSMGANGALFVMSALIMGTAKGFSEPATMIYVTDITPQRHYGRSFGLFLTLRDAGLLAGPIVLSGIADAAGLQVPYLLSGVAFVFVALMYGLMAREPHRRVAQPAESV